MNERNRGEDLLYPLQEAPEAGNVVDIAPGLLWTRLPLPYAPFHINGYLLEDEGGWVAVETGLNDAATHAAWEQLFTGPLRGARITRVLVTHWHSDHLGSAGWLCDRFDARLQMTEAEYLAGMLLQLQPRQVAEEVQRSFFHAHGLDEETTEQWVTNGHQYLRMMAPIPAIYHRLIAGDDFKTRGRSFAVHTVMGHSPEEVLLHGMSDAVFLCSDQVTPRLAPNLAVQANDPQGNPLKLYLESLDYIERNIPQDSLVLPAHDLPYRNLQARIDSLRSYYLGRCEKVARACEENPLTATDLLAVMMRRRPDSTWIGFVISEIVTYLNYLLECGRVTLRCEQGVNRYSAPVARTDAGA